MSPMTHRPCRVLVPTILSLCGGAALLAADAPAPAPAPAPTETVTVTSDKAPDFKPEEVSATKLDLTVQDTPQAMTVIPRALIDSQGSFSLRDALRNAPGLTLGAGEGGTTGDSFTIRGFTAQNDIYIDGVKDNGQYFRDTFNVEQVEVLKGTSSLLFGRGSVGGAVNQVTRKPTDHVEANVALTGGTDSLFRVSGGVSGPLVKGTLDGRIDGYAMSADSFRDEIHVNRKGVSPSVKIIIDEQSDLLLQSFHQREVSDIDYGLPRWKGRPADVDVSTFYGYKDDDFQEFDVDQYNVTFNHRFTDRLSFRNTTRYSVSSRYYRVNIPSSAASISDATAGTVYHVDPSLDTTSISQALRSSEQRGVFNQSDIKASGALAGHEATVTGGAEFGSESYDFRSKNSTGTVAAHRVSIFNPQQPDSWGTGRAENLDGPLTTHNDNSSTTVAFYGMGVVEVVEHLRAVAGVRWDQYDSNAVGNAGTPTATRLSQRDREYSPRAGLIFEPNDEVTVYASYGTSFSPTAESIAGSLTSATLVDPEKSRTYEVGVKTSLIDERLLVSASVFRVEKYNARDTDPATGEVSLDGNQRTDGIEVGAAGTITDKWKVFAGGTLLKARYFKTDQVTSYVDYDGTLTVIPSATGDILQYSTVANVRYEGNTLTNTPKMAGSLWTTYDVGLGFTVGGGVYLVGQRYINQANTETLPGYVRTDLTVGWGTRAADVLWNAQVNVSNVFDIVYYEATHPNFTAPGTPRAGQLTLSAAF